MTRAAAVRGTFYPSSKNEIEAMYAHYNKFIDDAIENKEFLKSSPKALIVPHAGYIYSGFTANVAYRVLKNSKPQRVVVIGPSHRVYIDGTSVGLYDSIETPFGDLAVDLDFANELKSVFKLNFDESAHHEHSTETQFPFIKHYLPETKAIELVYGKEEPQNLAKLIKYVLEEPNNCIIISTDLSHFYTLKEANSLDNICLDAVANTDFKKLQSGCEACGIIGVAGMMLASGELGLKPSLLDYRTSADASGDESRVVGYMSAMYTA